MKTIAKVLEVCPVVSGTSSNGNDWEKQTVAFETIGLEPQTLAVEFMGERKTKTTKTLEIGQQVEVEFKIKCEKFMERWYTRLDGLWVRPLTTTPAAAGTAPADAASAPDQQWGGDEASF